MIFQLSTFTLLTKEPDSGEFLVKYYNYKVEIEADENAKFSFGLLDKESENPLNSTAYYENVDDAEYTGIFEIYDDQRSSDGVYKLKLDVYSYTYDSLVSNVYEGSHTKEDLNTATDITESITNGTYEIDFSDGAKDFTVVTSSDYVINVRLSLTYALYNPKFGVVDLLRADSDGNLLEEGEGVPYIYGGHTYYGFNAETVDGRNRDTYTQSQYYQTMVVSDPEFDIKHVNLYVMTALGNVVWATEDNVTLKQLQSPGSAAILMDQDFSDGQYHFYHITSNGKVMNYALKIIQKTDNNGQGKLMVVGPQDTAENENPTNNTRRVFLYSGDYHDIYLRNIGDGDITELSVTLENAENVKLDEYWTLNNYTLPANQGENEAKVRLLNAGDGTISGTLLITYKESPDDTVKKTVRVKLTGNAFAYPMASIYPVGVKWVPYSALVSTNYTQKDGKTNMQVTEGNPQEFGLQLLKNGEIYGVPTKTGVCVFKVADPDINFGPVPVYIVIKDNYDDLVWNDSTAEPLITVGENTVDDINYESEQGYHYVIDDNKLSGKTFKSPYGLEAEFLTFWLNGKELVKGRDYDATEGSTVLTFKDNADNYTISGRNTISIEARNGNNNRLHSKSDYVGTANSGSQLEQHRTSQNVYLYKPETKPVDPTPTPTPTPSPIPSGPSSGGERLPSGTSNTASSTESETAKQEGGSITFVFKTPEGEAVQWLNIELHSRVQKGVTDEKGSVTFNGIEDGRHSVYAYNSEGKLLAKKSFRLSNNGTALTVNGKTYNMEAFKVTITVNEDVSAGAGLNDDGTVIESDAVVTDAGKAESHISYIVIMMLAAVIALGAVAKAKSSAK